MDLILARRKLVELHQKLHGLEAEFQYWLDQSEMGQPFRKHHTQIRAVKGQLESLQSKVRDKLKEAGQSGTTADKILSAGRNMQQMILAVHRIWEYFRSKLMQRQADFLVDYLRAADEFAWACYYPVQTTVYPDLENSRRKEPPLVFFNGGSSPFSVSRERAYQPEEVPNEMLSGSELKRVLDTLPIPVIGVPWHQVQHLPDALVIGHEVGHVVEDDFHLTDRAVEILQEALATGVDETRHAAWQSWLGEIFADLYGCLATGPAFVGALMDFMAIDPSRVMHEIRDPTNWGRYPTNALRMLINLRAIEELKFDKQSQELKKAWSTAYPTHQLSAYERDIAVIVPALLSGCYVQLGDVSLPKVLCFSVEQQDEAEQTVRQLAAGEALTSTDMRVLFAAARLAYEKDAERFVAAKDAERILAHAEAITTPNARASEPALEEYQLQRRDAQNQVAGSALFQTLYAMTVTDLQSPSFLSSGD